MTGSHAAPAPLAGWPVSVPGEARGAPVAAQLDGEGGLEVVVAVIGAADDARRRRGHEIEAKLHAFSAAGRAVAGWPVTVQDADTRRRMWDQIKDNPSASWQADFWWSAPSVADLDADGSDEIVVTRPGWHSFRGISAFHGDGTPWPFALAGRPDPWASIAVADIDGDGVYDLLSGNVLTSVAGQPVKGVAPRQPLLGGYQTAIADTNGDGSPEFFHSFYEKDWHLEGAPLNGTLGGFDVSGRPLPGWPIETKPMSMFPALGDITGDGKMEVVIVDRGGRLRAFTWDGKAVPTRDAAPSLMPQDLGVLASEVSSSAAVALADFTGDGRAEIIALTRTGHPVIFRGDGTPWATLGTVRRGGSFDGFAIAELDDDGHTDVFFGSDWFRVARDGSFTHVAVPGVRGVGFPPPTLADLTGDGLAEVLLSDPNGIVHAYATGKRLDRSLLHWQTRGANLRQTGAWVHPRRADAHSAHWTHARLSPSEGDPE